MKSFLSVSVVCVCGRVPHLNLLSLDRSYYRMGPSVIAVAFKEFAKATVSMG